MENDSITAGDARVNTIDWEGAQTVTAPVERCSKRTFVRRDIGLAVTENQSSRSSDVVGGGEAVAFSD